MSGGFFDEFPAFYSTSKTAASPNRLNNRYRALIEHNRAILAGARVLDVGSHDGRWSFAAIHAGASHVLGVEGRPYLVEHAIRSMHDYGVADARFQFVVGDIHEEIKRMEPHSVDVVFLFGIFYHSIRHAELLLQLRRLEPRHVIIDTAVAVTDEPIVLLEFNDPDKEAAAIRGHASEDRVLVGRPSTSALEHFLAWTGFDWAYFDWDTLDPDSWADLDDYKNRRRVSLVASTRR